ncbi:MAG: CNNM domain-containing protein [Mariprofundaceae bacterium]
MMNEIIHSLPLIIGSLLFLFLLSAFFSGSETALTRANKVRLRIRVEKGVKGSARASQLLKQQDRMLATILLGNNFVNIAASAITTALFIRWFGETGILYATIAMTILILIFAEILPKTIAVAHAESTACLVSTPLSWIMRVLSPLISLLMAMIELIKTLLRVPIGKSSELTHQELATIIDMSAESGVLDTAREQMLMSSLRLHEVPIKALMVPRRDIIMLDAAQSVDECLKQAIQKPHSRYPVFHENTDNIIGIIHLRALVKLKQKKTALVHAIIWKTPPFIPSGKNALAQLFDFQSQHIHMGIIVDEHGDIEGIITLEDIIEDIVGEIVDESDHPTPPEMWPQPDGSLVVEGTAGIHDINQTMDIDLPVEGVTTIGGLIIEMLGGLPEGKLSLITHNVRIEILSIKKQGIRRVLITIPPNSKNKGVY